MTERDQEMARRLADAVSAVGGRTFFVGGVVRDRLMGKNSDDVDVEVHGVDLPTLEAILDTLGERIAIGKSFGILGLRHIGLDIALPRSETATGRGHKDFDIQIDPWIGPENAARRRDFTINAMMQDVLTGEILDFFGGQADLVARRIRHVDDRSFGEDPLRVFRAAQFAARFDFTVAKETIAMASTMDVAALPGERVMGELKKALLQAEKPSLFFETLRQMDQLAVWFPEAEALANVPQDPRHHPEGDVWQHTMQVLDLSAQWRSQAQDPLGLMLSALCHDFGKAVATIEEDGRIHSYDHETAGLPLVRRFLERLVTDTAHTDYVLNMTELHMQPGGKMAGHASETSFMRTFDKSVSPDDLLLLAKADFSACTASPADREQRLAAYAPTEQELQRLLALYRERMQAPYLTGRDLLDAGATPGPLLGEALALAHKLRLAGRSKEEQRQQALGYLKGAAKKS
ncbi:MAG: HD domain-containing protein [Clostridia bacterium]|nr:HD domain-containing protein [Clostridia bacterium]